MLPLSEVSSDPRDSSEEEGVGEEEGWSGGGGEVPWGMKGCSACNPQSINRALLS